MNKKILVVSILAVFTLIAISFASAINTTTPVKKKESPLYGIRTRRAIGERLGEIIDNIKTRFLGDRIFFLPFIWLRNGERLSVRQRIGDKETQEGYTCLLFCWTKKCNTDMRPTFCTDMCEDTCEPNCTEGHPYTCNPSCDQNTCEYTDLFCCK